MQILKFKCRIKKEVKFKITPHNANSHFIMAKAGYGLGGIWNCPPQANRRDELLIAHGSDKVAGCFQFWRY